MVQPPIPPTALSEDQRAQAHTRFLLIRPALEDGVSQAQVARTHQISKSTIGRWVKRYREIGLAGLADGKAWSDKGTSRRLPAEAVTLIEGLALQTPPRGLKSLPAVSKAGQAHFLEWKVLRWSLGISGSIYEQAPQG